MKINGHLPGAVQVGGPADGSSITLNPSGGTTLYPAGKQTYFPGFPGDVRTATADVTGDGIPDLVGGAGPAILAPGGGKRRTARRPLSSTQ